MCDLVQVNRFYEYRKVQGQPSKVYVQQIIEK